MVVVNLKGENC